MRSLVGIAGPALLAIAPLGSCASAPARAPAPILVGVVVPLTGAFAEFGRLELDAVRLAVIELDRRGGVRGRPIEIAVEDSEHSSEKGAAAFVRLADELGVRFCYVASSEVAVAVAPLAESRGVLLVSDAASPAVSEACHRVLRHCPDAADECEAIAAHACGVLGARRLALMHVENAYGAAYAAPFRRSVEARGGEVAAVVSFPDSGQELDALVDAALARDPDATLVIGFGPSLGRIVERLRAAGYRGAVFTAASVAYPDTYASAPTALNGVLYADVAPAADDPRFAALAADYGALRARPPPPLVAMTHDAVSLVFEGMRATGDDPGRVWSWLAEHRERSGASGRLRILPDGRIRFELVILERTPGLPVRAATR